MMKTQILDLALATMLRAASSDGFRRVDGAKEFFRCSEIDTLLEANGEESFRGERPHPEIAMPAKETADLCACVIRRLLRSSGL